MGLEYRNLDDETRRYMHDELIRDETSNSVWLSDNLNSRGRAEFATLLHEAIDGGSDDTLAADIQQGRLNTHEKPRKLASGGLSKPPVMRSNAHTMLAEGEFNRYYVRAVCARALDAGIDEVVVYRGKDVANPRSESQRLIGTRVSAKALLDDLRQHKGMDTALGLPPGPNSGLTVRLP